MSSTTMKKARPKKPVAMGGNRIIHGKRFHDDRLRRCLILVKRWPNPSEPKDDGSHLVMGVLNINGLNATETVRKRDDSYSWHVIASHFG